MNSISRTRLLRLAVVAAFLVLATSPWLVGRAAGDPSGSGAIDHLLPFDGNAGWLNSQPLTPDSLSGKVVLVDFWEYTCVNCLRTIPYLKTWYSRYAQDGFVIIGVHSPEFNFSGDRGNLTAASQRLGVTWPVVLDDNHTVWERYHNQAWPEEYLFDQSGKLIDIQQGEGGYPGTEMEIQSLLKSKNPSLKLPPVMNYLPQDNYDVPGAMCYPETSETYVGPWHGQAIENAGTSNNPESDTLYQDNGKHVDGDVYLSGYWKATNQDEGMLGGSDGYLAIMYHAIQVVSVMRPEVGSSIRVDVTEDGKPVPKTDAGPDIQFDSSGMSYVTVDAPRAYELIDNAKFGQHDLKLTPQKYGLGVYSFAFESCQVPKAGS